MGRGFTCGVSTTCNLIIILSGSFKKEDLKALLVASLRFLMFFNGRPNYKDRIISSIHKIRNYLDRVKTDMLNDHQTKSPVQATEDSPLSSFKVLEKNSSSLPLTTVTETPSTNIGENVCMMKELQSNEESIQTPVVEIFNDIWGFIHQAW